jgi:hypothetical protein
VHADIDEKDWREPFQVEPLEKPFHLETEATECNANRLLAKELKCACPCGGKNHGAAFKKSAKSLGTFQDGNVALAQHLAEDPVNQTLSPEQYLEEPAVLA